MSVPPRLACFTLAGGVLIAVAALSPDLFGLPAQRGATPAELGLSDKLDRQSKDLSRRIFAKEMVVQEVIAGRLALLEAARWFRELNEQSSDIPDASRAAHPDLSADECACREVLAWTKAALADAPPSQAESLLRRLEEELRVHRQRHGGHVVLAHQ